MYWRHNTKVSYTWQNTAEATHSSATGPMRLAWLVPVLCSLPHHCTTRNPRKGYERHSQFKPTNLWNPPVHCSVSVPHVGLSRAFTRLLQLWDSRRHSHSSNELGEKHLHHQLIHFTTDSCSPKLSLCWDEISFFAAATARGTLQDSLSFTRASFCPPPLSLPPS